MKTNWSPFVLVLVLFFLASGCTVAGPKGTLSSLPKERATECQQLCETLGMRLGAVVIIMNAAGCVCEVIDKTRTTAFSAAAAGGAAINMVVQMRRQQQQRATQYQAR